MEVVTVVSGDNWIYVQNYSQTIKYPAFHQWC